ncbi:MAG: hypothetical protein AAGE52_11900 [Myxococcota bacterium]
MKLNWLVCGALLLGTSAVSAQGYDDGSGGYDDGSGGYDDGSGGSGGYDDGSGGSSGGGTEGGATQSWETTDDSVVVDGAGTGSYPVNRTLRPITLPQMHLRGSLFFSISRIDLGPLGDDTATFLDLSASFGILDDLEVGFGDRPGSLRQGGLVPLTLSPDADYNDIYLYGRYRLLNLDSVELGVELGLNIPVDTDFGIQLGVPVRIRAGNIFSLDTGVEFLILTDPTDLFLSIPLKARIAPIDPLWIGVDTGFLFPFLDDFEGEFFAIPLGFSAGYTLELNPMQIEIFTEFNFPLFLGPARDDVVFTDIWTLGFGARVVVDLDGG